jgi:hypothetical protein
MTWKDKPVVEVEEYKKSNILTSTIAVDKEDEKRRRRRLI